ncbi:isochorismatase family protein [Paraburkholderia kururiensis]|uniref:isochorismatase family protein n=1 Tax=Paraburkholderia kururiensis TaxID=984307 RepID=UPI0005AB5E18|nr:isochorismatase family protein [Paraburkholderia kururiensis]
MAVTTLDPNTALIIVDPQKDIVGSSFIRPIDGVVSRSRALLDAFRERGLPVVLVLVNVAGVATGAGVESTSRQAYGHGFNVTLALDAMTDARPEAHDYSIKNVFPKLGEMGTARDIIDLLAMRSV